MCKEVKPSYLSIFTQTCDLREHNAKWKSEIISVSLVYRLKQFAVKIIDDLVNSDSDIDRHLWMCKIINDKHKNSIMGRLCDIVQYKCHDYFLYHSDITYDIQEDYCTNLRITIPLATSEYYDLLLEKKVAQLEGNIRDRFGYNISYLFSRVGIDDPDTLFVNGRKTSLLSDYKYLSNEKIAEIQKSKEHLNAITNLHNIDEKYNYIEGIHIDSNMDVFRIELLKHLEINNLMTPQEREKFVAAFTNKRKVRSIIK